MGKQEIIKIIRNKKPEMESRYGVQRLGLFGSYVRGRQKKKSDIDILVTFNRDIDLFDFLDLRKYLESQLQAKVDLVMETALKPAIGKRILSEVEYMSKRRELSGERACIRGWKMT
ncbi:MAG: nucleotidyltransferase family protein [Proteobacteria bacterium]|nr:nucleotidyltransferase family protein [Pseudomonadota bacterium]